MRRSIAHAGKVLVAILLLAATVPLTPVAMAADASIPATVQPGSFQNSLTLVARPISPSAADVRWAPYPGATAYRLFRRDQVPGRGSEWVLVAQLDGLATGLVDTALSPGRSYTYVLIAVAPNPTRVFTQSNFANVRT